MKQNIILIRESLSIIGGAERVMSGLCNELSASYNIYCVNIYKNEGAYKLKDNVNVIELCNKKRKMRYMLIPAVKKLRHLIVAQKVKIIICVGMTGVLISYLASLKLPVKVVFFEQSTLNKNLFLKYGWKEKLYDRLVQYIINSKMTRIITLTEKEKKNYKNRYPGIVSPIEVIPNFLDSKLECKQCQYDVTAKKIITVGRFSYAKGYEHLVQVAKIVFNAHPDWEWHVYGTGEDSYVEYIKSMIKEAGLSQNIFLMGTTNDIYDLYPLYAMEILTSRYEGFSLVLLEGKANCLPEIAFDVYSGPSDLILDGINGYLIEPFNVVEMADKICYLIENDSIRENFSKHARDNIEQFFISNVIKKWCKLINDTIENKN